MKKLIVNKVDKLSGEVCISGAKNAVLPLICATLLSDKNVLINNVPNVMDVHTLSDVLRGMGGTVNFNEESLQINCSKISSTKASYEMVQKMRASILVLGPLLARFGHCEISLPGGCAIGDRPVDLHLKAMELFGAEIKIHDGYIEAVAKTGLKGADIIFDKITVGGTENALMAAALADGKSTIINAAQEPEVIQLCEFLESAGVEISGIGTSEITLTGTNGRALTFPQISVIPDRIEAGTYLCAAAITKSKLKITNVNTNHLINIVSKLQEMGCDMDLSKNEVTISCRKKIKPIQLSTQEYPGFPTDMQAQFMAVLTQATGVSTIEENLFENRFMCVAEFRRLGAKIQLSGKTASVVGPVNLQGTNVTSTDLRASASLLLLGLISEGNTVIHNTEHLLRGYDRIIEKFSLIGAHLEFVE